MTLISETSNNWGIIIGNNINTDDQNNKLVDLHLSKKRFLLNKNPKITSKNTIGRYAMLENHGLRSNNDSIYKAK